MKRHLFILLLIIPGLLINGQNIPFKTIEKKQGPARPDFAVAKLKASPASKSASTQKFPQVRDFTKPVITGSNQSLKKVITSDRGPVYIERKGSAVMASPEERLYKFLDETKDISGYDNSREIFIITGIRTDELGITHIKTVQQYKGVEIYGSESILHINAGKERFTGSFHKPGPDTETTPAISSAAAVQNAISDVRGVTMYKELSPKEKDLLHYSSPECALVLLNAGKNEYRLAWSVSIRPNFIEEWKYFIDAASGGVIRKFNNTNSDGAVTATATDLNGHSQTINTYLDAGTYYLIDVAEPMFVPSTDEGVIMTLDANQTSATNLDYRYVTSTNNTWPQKNTVSAHNNATRAYRYFRETFNRNSLNDQGGNIISFVNVTEDDGSSMENAFWNGQAVFYGNGGTIFSSLAGALDVAAHELGHGVVSNTANLEYYGQSGAINESYADIFGAMVDRDDWLIGEDITSTSYSPSGALRDMADPHNMGTSLSQPYWQPKTLSEMYLGSQDNGGVHINSGIGNYVYYLFATAVSKEKAEQVYYKALNDYLTKNSQFIDLRIAVIQAASDLYGPTSQEVTKAGDAFTAAGIQEEVQVDKTQNYDVNNGQEYLLSYDTYEGDDKTLHRTSGDGTDILLSTRPMKSKVSVTDDGSMAVFVSDDHYIRYMSLDPANPYEDILSASDYWDNVAISKDGNRLAAISKYIDSTIYVFDLTTKGPPVAFPLYNPTTSDSITEAGGVLYADAIEFDMTGQYLIYDAANVLRSSTSADINYWDIGFINVWNNNTGTFGDGTISKLFGSLPENISIGNPVFSKNSPWIIAFDYIDQAEGVYYVLGADLNEGVNNAIAENNTLGFPSFSKNDNKIAFTRIYYSQTDEAVEWIASIGLAADKITPSGSITKVIDYATWPVYYATGERNLSLPPVADFTADKKTGDAPLQVKFIDLSGNQPTSWAWTLEGGTPATSTQQNPVVNYNTPGTYKVTLKATNTGGNNSIIKDGYIIVKTATGVEENEANKILIYPNPVRDNLYIICEDDFSVRLYNINGRIIYSGINNRLLDMSAVEPGIYVLEIITGHSSVIHKIIREE